MSDPLAPGLYDLHPDKYFADPQAADGGSVTSSICRKILPPDGCPAIVDHERRHRKDKTEFDLGHAVHTLLLGKGARLRTLVDEDGEPFGSYNTKASRAARDVARAEGDTPLLAHQRAAAEDAAAAVMADPDAARLLAPGTFRGEQTLIWRDPVLGVWRRAMVDALADDLVVDVKTCTSASPRAVGKSVAEWKYDQQQAFYDDGVTAVLGRRLPFVFVFVQITPPHLVNVVTLPAGAVDQAHARNREAIELWSWCTETDTWPKWPTAEGITEAELPTWYYRPNYWEGI